MVVQHNVRPVNFRVVHISAVCVSGGEADVFHYRKHERRHSERSLSHYRRHYQHQPHLTRSRCHSDAGAPPGGATRHAAGSVRAATGQRAAPPGEWIANRVPRARNRRKNTDKPLRRGNEDGQFDHDVTWITSGTQPRRADGACPLLGLSE